MKTQSVPHIGYCVVTFQRRNS